MDLKINRYQFQPDRQKYSKEFMLSKYNKFRGWYFKNHNKEQLNEYKEKYYNYLKLLGVEIPFAKWLTKIRNPKIQISNETRTWDTSDGKIITSKHPPIQNIKYGNIEATSYLKIDQKINEDIAIIIKQNNYIHLHLQTFATHLSQLEDKWMPREKRKDKIINN